MYLDVSFQLHGDEIPFDHGYALYSALSGEIPEIHEENNWGVHRINGQKVRPGKLSLTRDSRLKIRVPQSDAQKVISFAGSTVYLQDHRLAIGVPEIGHLEPSRSLKTGYATIKGHMDKEGFGEAMRRQIQETLDRDVRRSDIEVGGRNTIEVNGYQVVGFGLRVQNIGPKESLKLQEKGVGGKRKMGAGILTP